MVSSRGELTIQRRSVESQRNENERLDSRVG